MRRPRRNHTAAFKAKVVMALKQGGDAHQRCLRLLEMSVQTGQWDRR